MDNIAPTYSSLTLLGVANKLFANGASFSSHSRYAPCLRNISGRPLCVKRDDHGQEVFAPHGSWIKVAPSGEMYPQHDRTGDTFAHTNDARAAFFVDGNHEVTKAGGPASDVIAALKKQVADARSQIKNLNQNISLPHELLTGAVVPEANAVQMVRIPQDINIVQPVYGIDALRRDDVLVLTSETAKPTVYGIKVESGALQKYQGSDGSPLKLDSIPYADPKLLQALTAEPKNPDPEQPTAQKNPQGVSVVIAYHNKERHIKETLDSIMAQGFTGPAEIVIVNDASNAQSREQLGKIVEELKAAGAPIPINIVDNKKNLGAPGARNIGIIHAQYEYILPVDADDLLTDPRKTRSGQGLIQQGFDILSKNDSVNVVAPDILNFGHFNKVEKFPDFSIPTFLERCTIWTPAMFRRSQAMESGLYDVTLKYVEDFAFWTMMIHHADVHGQPFKVHQIREPLYEYRRQASGSVWSGDDVDAKHLKGWRAVIERFPGLYAKYFAGVPREGLPEHFLKNEHGRTRALAKETSNPDRPNQVRVLPEDKPKRTYH